MMSDRSQYLLDLAKRTAEIYITNPKTKAALLTGSVAEGLCDEYSDCEMIFYYGELPFAEELRLARQQNQGSELLWSLGSLEEGSFGESYLINGIEFQIGHETIVNWEKDIAAILEDFDLSPMMKALQGTLIGIPLYGDALIQKWKNRIANYPEELAIAMIQHYLRFVPVWGMQEKIAKRDATLWYHQILVESVQNLLGVLAGLNRLYYSTFQFKRMRRFVGQMRIAPENLSDRLEALFRLEPAIAVIQLEAIIQETVALIEIHMPQIDTSAVKQKLGWRQQPWRTDQPVD